MLAFDNGAWFTVTVTKREVVAFKARWPCSGLPDKAITFQFDKRNGDLVDILTPNSESFDGPALAALSEDACAYGVKRFKLTDYRSVQK